MTRPTGDSARSTASAIADRAARGQAVAIERMPTPSIRLGVAMRNGIRLDTFAWLPEGAPGPFPAILLRTPYQEHVLGWARLGILRYRTAGYALVVQVIRGVGSSEGTFGFNAPHDRTDGYDTVEWVAAQPWCDGNVGMDCGSYVGMTQLTAATAEPPHLKCIIPSVPSADFFREIPYSGGGFGRQHTLTWTQLISVESLAELTGGFAGVMPLLANPEWVKRLMMRPAVAAADDLLEGDKLAHYRDVLAHPTFDDWWRERTIMPEDYARIGIPTMVVSGNFDLSIGALTVWRGLENNAPPAERFLLIGPWDHGQSYVGAGERYGPYQFPDHARLDPFELRLAFFERHLKGAGAGPDLGGRVKVYLTGANEWRSFEAFPPAAVETRTFYLHSGGRANTHRGDGRLDQSVPNAESPDHVTADPTLPFVPAMTNAAAVVLDARELIRHSETLVYATAPLEAPLTILGEATAELFVSADTPDADVAVWLAELTADGGAVQLAQGFLRLRYREGWDREVLLEPGKPVRISVPLTYVGHQIPAGHRLALLAGPGNFPWVDPNPNTGEPIATATQLQRAEQVLWHDAGRPSRLLLPCLPR